MLLLSLKKKISYFGQGNILFTFIKSIIASIFMGVVTMYIYNYSQKILSADVISLTSSILIGAIVYYVLLILLKVDEAKFVYNSVKYKIARGEKL